jgi:hypothetical protein
MGALLMETEQVLITDLHVECSLQTHNFNLMGVAMSDCCRRVAKSGVVLPNGRTMWRCRDHEGMVDFRTGEKGEVVYVVTRIIKE